MTCDTLSICLFIANIKSLKTIINISLDEIICFRYKELLTWINFFEKFQLFSISSFCFIFRGLADVNGDGQMDVNEFSLACKMITMKLKGFEVPKTLPPAMAMTMAAVHPPNSLNIMGMQQMQQPQMQQPQMQQPQMQQPQMQQQQMMNRMPGTSIYNLKKRWKYIESPRL